MDLRIAGLIAAVSVTVALMGGGDAAAEKPVTSVRGNVHAEFNAGFTPKTLSTKRREPVAFFLSVRPKTRDGSHVPPLKEILFEADRDASISVKGVPKCELGSRSPRPTLADIRRLCGEALVGSGRMNMEIEFPDQKPILANSDLLALNGGREGGVTTVYLYAYLTVPTPAMIITTITAKRIDKGRYGLLLTATIPKIAGGSGSATYFKLRLRKGILSAKCTDGRLAARAGGVFGTTPQTRLRSAVGRTCTVDK